MPLNSDEFKHYLEPFVEDLPEVYQDIEAFGQVLWKGKRDCEGRWKAIKDKIKPNSVVFDLGSATGYFAKKIAQEFPTCTVVSMECGEAEAEVQREILSAENIFNVCLLKHRLTISDMRLFARCVSTIDFLLAFSILHHFPSEVALEVLQIFSRAVPEIAAEMPEPEEVEACGQNAIHHLSPFDEVLSTCYPSVISLDDFASHLGDYQRTVWYGKKLVVREALLSYWDCPNTIKTHAVSKVGGQWKIDQKPNFVSGVNVWTLLQFNPIWPLPGWWQKQARTAWERVLQKHDYVSDIRPWNMLFHPFGLVPIDFTDKFPKGDQAEYREGDIEKLERIFLEMKPLEWKGL